METQNEETDKMAKRLLVDYFNKRLVVFIKHKDC